MYRVIDEVLRPEGIPYFIGPYEADAQLGALAHCGLVHCARHDAYIVHLARRGDVGPVGEQQLDDRVVDFRGVHRGLEYHLRCVCAFGGSKCPCRCLGDERCRCSVQCFIEPEECTCATSSACERKSS